MIINISFENLSPRHKIVDHFSLQNKKKVTKTAIFKTALDGLNFVLRDEWFVWFRFSEK